MDNSLKEQATRTIELSKSISGNDKHYGDESIGNSPIFLLNGDYVERLTPMPEVGNNICKSEKVMDKKTFIECYKKWIAPEEESDGWVDDD